jgi:8-oxo-dGTP pyrophosphatase MutT (NUDIX family)
MRRILELGEKKSYEKEPPNAWVFRILGLYPEDYSGFELKSVNGKLFCGVPDTGLGDHTRLELEYETHLAIESWIQFGTNPDDHTQAASILIHNKARTSFLLQQKDHLHPNKSCRGRYSLFGGSPRIGEPIKHAAIRELFEEIRFKDLGLFLHHLFHVDDLTLNSVQWPGTYTCSIFSLEIPDDVFPKLVHSIVVENNVAESTGTLLERQHFHDILWPHECASPGKYFVASHHLAINRILTS